MSTENAPLVDELFGTINDHSISIHREGPHDDWYITVTDPTGIHCYDGWWDNSAGKTIQQALNEAIDGSYLLGARP